MSDTTALSQLARFVGKSMRATEAEAARRANASGKLRLPEARTAQRRAVDLLGTVLALSARARRVVQPRTMIDLDVFTPEGHRAVEIFVGQPED